MRRALVAVRDGACEFLGPRGQPHGKPPNWQGYISSDEFLSIPELSINPLAQRLSFMVEGVNFRDFVKLVSTFSTRASREQKLKLMFDVYDYDGGCRRLDG